MGFLLFLLQDLNYLEVSLLETSKYVAVLQVLNAFGIEPFIFNETVDHFEENSIIGAQHHPQIVVSIHFKHEK